MKTASFNNYFFIPALFISVIVSAVLIVIMFSTLVSAQGGSGSGGAGGGCVSTFWCTGYGWGWGVFDINSGGPSDGFKNGTAWSTVYNTCSGAGARSVLIHIIQDSDYSGRGYDYLRSQEAMSYRMPVGSYIDRGRAPVVSTATAEGAFNSLDPSLRGGLTFGVDVAWMCYNLTPPTNSGSCSISLSPSSLNPGQPFTANFTVNNTGGVNWSVDATNANRYRLGTENARDNMTWGINRLEIPGRSAGWFGQVLFAGESGSFSRSFTAPASAGTYSFSWRILEEGRQPIVGSACSATLTVATPPLTCPGQPSPPIHTVSLPGHYYQPDYTGSIAWSAPPPTRHTTETRYTSHEDISDSNWGGLDRPPTLVSQAAGNPGNVRLDYTPYITDYPFDYNQPRVTYNESYYTRTYGLDGPYYYPVYRWEYVPDPDGTGPQTGYWRQVFDYWQLGGYYVTSSVSGNTNESWTVNGPRMDPCFLRTYDTTSVNVSQPQLTPDRESPSTATMSSATINLQFGVTQSGRGLANMRLASRANNLPYQMYYRIQRSGTATPAAGGLGWLPNASGNVTIAAGSTAQTATGSASVSGNNVAVTVEQSLIDLRVGDRVCWWARVSEERGNINVNGARSSTSGNFDNVNCSQPVVNWPYIEVYGNDVISGGSFGGSCSPVSQTIRVFSRSGQFRGASTQYAAFAMGTINGFTSASLRDGAGNAAQAPLGLSFANTAGAYGGSYAANDGLTCLPDYFAARPATATAIANTSGAIASQFVATNSDPQKIEYFTTTGPLILSGTPTAVNGVRKVFYIDGTLTINSNITTSTSWTNRNQVPYVMFIARDIVINGGVTQLDGVFAAQPGGGGTGTISTCQTPNYGTCTNGLVINGAFVANRVNLWRTRGSLRHARVNEGRPGVTAGSLLAGCSAGAASAAGTRGGPTCAGEVFSFNPEIFLTLSEILNPDDDFKLDSYVNLPPNL